MSDLTGSAGRGRLAEVLAMRGGRAEPEAPFVIEHREALIYMLCQAAELEHGLTRHYPAGVNLTLVPFGEPGIQHFMFLERPEGMALEGDKGIDAPMHDAVPHGRRRHRPPAAGLRHRRPPLSLDRARSGAPR